MPTFLIPHQKQNLMSCAIRKQQQQLYGCQKPGHDSIKRFGANKCNNNKNNYNKKSIIKLDGEVLVSSLALRSPCVLDIRSPEPKINQQLHQYRTGTNYN